MLAYVQLNDAPPISLNLSPVTSTGRVTVLTDPHNKSAYHYLPSLYSLFAETQGPADAEVRAIVVNPVTGYVFAVVQQLWGRVRRVMRLEALPATTAEAQAVLACVTAEQPHALIRPYTPDLSPVERFTIDTHCALNEYKLPPALALEQLLNVMRRPRWSDTYVVLWNATHITAEWDTDTLNRFLADLATHVTTIAPPIHLVIALPQREGVVGASNIAMLTLPVETEVV